MREKQRQTKRKRGRPIEKERQDRQSTTEGSHTDRRTTASGYYNRKTRTFQTFHGHWSALNRPQVAPDTFV